MSCAVDVERELIEIIDIMGTEVLSIVDNVLENTCLASPIFIFGGRYTPSLAI